MCSISVCDIIYIYIYIIYNLCCESFCWVMESSYLFPQKKLADVWAKSFCHSQSETENSLSKPFAITNQML